ncbi:MAG: hypothetical protein WBO97_12555, partial [Tepidiformaceae bacterium]
DAGLALAKTSAPGSDQSRLRIVSPGDSATLFISPELDSQQLLLRATAAPGTQSIAFAIDGLPAGSGAGSDVRIPYPISIGSHRLTATATLADGDQETTTITFEVKAK